MAVKEVALLNVPPKSPVPVPKEGYWPFPLFTLVTPDVGVISLIPVLSINTLDIVDESPVSLVVVLLAL